MHKNSLIVIGIVIAIVLGFVLLKNSGSRTTLPVAAASQVVNLKSGDTYTLAAGYVMKTIAGSRVKMLAYNGMIPGPEIHVAEGAEVMIHFVNNIDMPTLLHSHGVRVTNANDGSQLTQREIQSGETYDYTVKFTDPGTYFYHPHVREDRQQALGLFGAYVVTPNAALYWSPVDHEHTLFLSDILLEEGSIAPFSDNYVTHALMGRFGDTLLINGETTMHLNAEPGEVQRFAVVNSATTRTFNFRIKDAQMKLVGADNGRYEKEQFVDGVILAPSERAIVEVYFPKAGTYAIEHKTPNKIYPLGEVRVSGESPKVSHVTEFSLLRANADLITEFNEMRSAYLTKSPDKTLLLTLTSDMAKIMQLSGSSDHAHNMGGMTTGSSSTSGMDMSGMSGMNMAATPKPIEWEDDMGRMNAYSTSDTVKWILRDKDTGKENMDIVWQFKKGAMVKIRLVNDSTSMHPMQHPIHFHGNRFLVLATNGIPNDNMVWKDTTLVKNGDTVDVLLEASNPGKWMGHCHIAEHLHSGMMMEYDVTE